MTANQLVYGFYMHMKIMILTVIWLQYENKCVIAKILGSELVSTSVSLLEPTEKCTKIYKDYQYVLICQWHWYMYMFMSKRIGINPESIILMYSCVDCISSMLFSLQNLHPLFLTRKRQISAHLKNCSSCTLYIIKT